MTTHGTSERIYLKAGKWLYLPAQYGPNYEEIDTVLELCKQGKLTREDCKMAPAETYRTTRPENFIDLPEDLNAFPHDTHIVVVKADKLFQTTDKFNTTQVKVAEDSPWLTYPMASPLQEAMNEPLGNRGVGRRRAN